MSKPLVSILSPCYNVEAYLRQCLDSIINQTYSNLQIVLIDDGSSDGTWQIMQEYAAKNPRIEIYHQENCGVATTRNHLIEKIKGEYFLFVDSDDWVEPAMVETLLELMDSHQSDIAMCRHSYANEYLAPSELERCNSCQTVWNQEEAVKKFLFHKELSGSLWNKLVKTSLLHNHRFNADISYGEDALFVWKLLQHIAKLAVTEVPLYHYRMNPVSISHQQFGAKKLTGHKVWKIITNETSEWWPNFVNIVKARWGVETMYLLMQAAAQSYKKDSLIAMMQRTVRQNLPSIKSSGLLTGKEILNAYMISVWYEYGRFYYSLFNIKGTIVNCLNGWKS